MPLIETLEQLVKPPIEAEGCRLYELSLVVERGDKFLRILLEKPGTRIDMDLIVRLTRAISSLLDANPLISEHYILDIASAGIDYPIRMEHLQNYLHTIVQVYCDPQQQGKPGTIGELLAISDSEIYLSVKTKKGRVEQTIAKKEITRIEVARES
jgi:ribosome maturation factor RimP